MLTHNAYPLPILAQNTPTRCHKVRGLAMDETMRMANRLRFLRNRGGPGCNGCNPCDAANLFHRELHAPTGGWTRTNKSAESAVFWVDFHLDFVK